MRASVSRAFRFSSLALLLVASTLATSPRLPAQTWSDTGSPGFWSTAGNWTGGLPANNGTADIVISNNTPTVNPFLDADWNVRTLSFTGTGVGSPKITGSTTTPATLTLQQGLTVTSTYGASPATRIANIKVNLAATQSWNIAADAAVSGSIIGAGGLVKTGAGTLTLELGNTYSGGTIIQQGRVSVAGDSSLGDAAGAVTLNGGALFIDRPSVSLSRAMTVGAAGGTIFVKRDFSLGSAITGAGSLDLTRDNTTIPFTAADTLTLTGNSNFTGGLNLTNPGGSSLWTVRATGATSGLGNGLVTIGSNVALSLANASNLGAGGQVRLDSGSQLYVNDQVNLATIIHSGSTAATIGLQGPAYATALNLATLGDGTLSLGAGESDATYTAATLGVGAGNIYRLGGGSQTLTIAGTDNVLTGSASLQATGPVALANANNFTGGVSTTSLGKVRVGNSGSLGSGLVTMASGSVTTMDGTGPITLANNFLLSGGPNFIGGGGTGGPLTLAGTIDLSGGTTMIFPNDLTITGDIVNGGLSLNGGNATLVGAKSFAGGLLLGSTRVSIANENALGAGAVTVSYSEISTTANTALTKPVNFYAFSSANYLALSPAANTTLTLASTLVGTGDLKMTGAGNLVIATNLPLTLQISAGHATASGSRLASNSVGVNGTGTYDGSGQVGKLNLATGSTVRPASGNGVLKTGELTFNLFSGSATIETAFNRPGGVDYLNETNSGNGLLYASSIGTGNFVVTDPTIRLFFTSDNLQVGEVFQGSLFIAGASASDPALATLFSHFDFDYLIQDDGGAIVWNGQHFSRLADPSYVTASWANTVLDQPGAILQFQVTQAVPEPGTWALLLSGAAFLARRRRRR